MSASHPLWFRFLREKREVDGHTGFTIPFLIGAKQSSLEAAPALDEHAASVQLAHLLTEMRDFTPSTHFVWIALCNETHEPIAAVYKIAERTKNGAAIASAAGRHALYIQDRYCPNRKRGLDSVFEYFWEKDQYALTHALYSFNNGSYGPFNDADLKWIARVRK